MSRLYLIRHAQASLGSDDYDQLSPLGVRQAEILGDYFRDLGLTFDAVYSGEMKRQLDTARPVISRMYPDRDAPDLRIRREFNEYDAHTIIRSQIPAMLREDPSFRDDLQNLVNDGEALKRVFSWAMLKWVAGEFTEDGVETWLEFVERVQSGVDAITTEHEPDRRVAVFTSGGAISATVRLALKLSPEETTLLPLQTINTGVSVFRYGDGEFGLSSFNCAAHLELRREPSLITYR